MIQEADDVLTRSHTIRTPQVHSRNRQASTEFHDAFGCGLEFERHNGVAKSARIFRHVGGNKGGCSACFGRTIPEDGTGPAAVN